VPAIVTTDLDRMRTELLFDGPSRARKLSRFWILLILAAVIASAGVVGDSTATVIGAMIVAPLMTPILGAVLSIVTTDRANLIRSIALIVGGAVLVVGVGWLLGLLVPVPVDAATSSQVASRVHPRLVDLVAALATGTVGAFALVRDDVGDTLPGVAIAISLVPPLAVVGLTLEAGAMGQAAGAGLLFVTNVTAILASGVVVMSLYRVHRIAQDVDRAADPTASSHSRRRAAAVVAVLLVVVAVPLALTSATVARNSLTHTRVSTIADEWAAGTDWEVVSIESRGGSVVVRAIGPLPSPDPQDLRRSLDEGGLEDTDVRLELVPEERIALPAG
jgi:uncharacterized hydrophobic protein (TIGR00271 family)